MWTPTASQRTGLIAGAVAGITATAIAGFYGPATIPTFGPPSPAATAEVQLLSALAMLSAIPAALSARRSNELTIVAVICTGLGGLLTGGYLAFGYWVPALNGANEAPYTLQGAEVMLWGILVVLLTPLVAKASRRTDSPLPLPGATLR